MLANSGTTERQYSRPIALHDNALNAPMIDISNLLLRQTCPDVSVPGTPWCFTHQPVSHVFAPGRARYVPASFLEHDPDDTVLEEGHHLIVCGGDRQAALEARAKRMTCAFLGRPVYYQTPVMQPHLLNVSFLASRAHDPEIRHPEVQGALKLMLGAGHEVDPEPIHGRPIIGYALSVRLSAARSDAVTTGRRADAEPLMRNSALLLLSDVLGAMNAHARHHGYHGQVEIFLDEAGALRSEGMLASFQEGLHDIRMRLARARMAAPETCLSISTITPRS